MARLPLLNAPRLPQFRAAYSALVAAGLALAAAGLALGGTAIGQEPPPRNESQPFRPAIPPLPENVNLESGTGSVTSPSAPQTAAPQTATPQNAAPQNTTPPPPSSFSAPPPKLNAAPVASPAAMPPPTTPPAPAPTTFAQPVTSQAVTGQPMAGQPMAGQPMAVQTQLPGEPRAAQQPLGVSPSTPSSAAAGSRSTSLTDQTANAGWQQNNPSAPPGTSAPPAAAPSGGAPPAEITRVSQTFSSLPNNAGQVWREYDISPYTSQVRDNPNPEQAIVDWILRQTGTELWFRQPFGLLSATRDKLFVYHTPEIHNEIRPLVDRFVFSKGQTVGIDVRLCTIANPNWRETAYSVMQSIPVQSPGVEAWLISKENAALLFGNLSRRSDFRASAGGRVSPQDGQPFVLEQRTPRQFAQSLQWTPGQGAGYQPLMNQLNEGYRLKLTSLSSVDGRTVDLLLEGSIDQIEKFNNIRVPIATVAGTQNFALQVPQLVSWRLTERFRWPADQVLLISCGVVGAPDATSAPSPTALFGQPLGGLFDSARKRADALLLIDYRGPQSALPTTPQTTQNNLVPIR